MEQVLILKERKGKITTASDLFKRIEKIKIDYTQENFMVFYLDTQNNLKGYEIVFKGGLNTLFIDPKTIFRKALLKNANSIILAHNHPSNELEPSYEDRDAFNKLKDAGEVIRLKVLDSIIFNKNRFYSIA